MPKTRRDLVEQRDELGVVADEGHAALLMDASAAEQMSVSLELDAELGDVLGVHDEGKLREAAHGLYHAPVPTKFGPAPAAGEELLRAYHRGEPFLVTGPPQSPRHSAWV